MSELVTAGAVVTPAGVLRPGWVEVAADRVVAVGGGGPGRPADVDLADAILTPGFVDGHVHGGGGASFGDGDPDAAARAVAWHRARGTTTTMASLVSEEPDELRRQVAALADLVQDGLLAGLHLEGPWLASGKRGAHAPQALRPPDPEEVDDLVRVARGSLRMVTLAPELPGGVAAVRRLVSAGVRVGIGHTEADYATTREAADAGATVATHLFNAMPPMHHRAPGPALALLEDDRVVLELVADGTHVHPALVRHVVASAGSDRVALVTDAMAAAGGADGSYRLGALEVAVRDGIARLADGTIAGSTASTSDLYASARSATGEDLVRAAALTAATPARMLGLTDVGEIRPGFRADLVGLRDSRVVAVMAAGRWVPEVG